MTRLLSRDGGRAALPRYFLAAITLMSSCESGPVDAPFDSAAAPQISVTRTPATSAGATAGTPAASAANATKPSEGTPPARSARSTWNLCAALASRAGIELPAADGVSWAQLLCEVADLDRFTHAGPPHTSRMASSRDTKSVTEGGEGWFANEDFGHFLRDDGDEHVLLEDLGPGALTRIWTARPAGTLRIYIDGKPEPAMAFEFARLFRDGPPEPIRAPFSYVQGKGWNLIFPIPYASSVRVTVSRPQPKLFYQVNYRSYPAGTVVEPYSPEGAQKLVPLAREVAKLLNDPADQSTGGATTTQTVQLSDAQPEQRIALGPSVVRELVVRGIQPDEQWLRRTRLILTIDGERAVDAPIGSLFTADLGVTRPHTSAVASASPSALTLRWPMPVRGELGVRLESNGGRIGSVSMQLQKSDGLPENPLFFHARWSGTKRFDSLQPVDWNVVTLLGSGYYVGTVFNAANPAPQWWGEGDEKIFVDGEATPSLFGTGTEDYFGYAWCYTQQFATPWNGLPRVDGAMNWGRNSQYRWHVLDAIPFSSSLRFQLEVLHWLSAPLMNPAPKDAVELVEDAVAIWYASPGSKHEAPELPLTAFEMPRITTARPFWPLPYDCEYASLIP